MSHIELTGISRAYASVAAVQDVSLAIEKGEFVALLGPSGCGKTTTLNMIAGFLDPDTGDIRMNGSSIVREPVHKRRLGMVFQNYALFPHMTVYENVAFGLKMQRVRREDIRPRVTRALEMVQLGNHGGRYPRELSGGQQQRVALARALVPEPEALLLDEPLSNLDANLRAEMRVELRALQRRLGITMVFVTHDQSEALSMADRLVVMNHGLIEQTGTPADVYERPSSRFVATFIGSSNVLEGEVAEVTSDAVRVNVDGLNVWARGAIGVRTGTPVSVIVRPEHIRVGAGDTAGANAIRGQVRDVAYLGPTRSVQLDVAGRTVVLAVDSRVMRDAFVPGADVVVSWSPEDCIVLTGERAEQDSARDLQPTTA